MTCTHSNLLGRLYGLLYTRHNRQNSYPSRHKRTEGFEPRTKVSFQPKGTRSLSHTRFRNGRGQDLLITPHLVSSYP